MRKLIPLIMLIGVAIPGQAHARTGSCPQYEPLFRKYGLPVKQFSYIAWRESRCNPRTVSAVRKSTGRPDVGLLQIQGSWYTVTKTVCHLTATQNHIKALTTLPCQLSVARYLYQHGGLGHWKASSGIAKATTKK